MLPELDAAFIICLVGLPVDYEFLALMSVVAPEFRVKYGLSLA